MLPMNNSISSELISAISALNTEVTYQGPTHINGDYVYISAAEPLVGHSIEHINAALHTVLNNIRKDINRLHVLLINKNSTNFSDQIEVEMLLQSIKQKL
jgi:hypothetical protein